MKKMIPIYIPLPPQIKIGYHECHVETTTNGDIVVTVYGDMTACETYNIVKNAHQSFQTVWVKGE